MRTSLWLVTKPNVLNNNWTKFWYRRKSQLRKEKMFIKILSRWQNKQNQKNIALFFDETIKFKW